jgi:hypothetical protein
MGSEVNHPGDAMVFEKMREPGCLGEISLDEPAAGDHLPVPLGEIIINNKVIPPLPEPLDHVGTDVACAARHEDHLALPSK